MYSTVSSSLHFVVGSNIAYRLLEGFSPTSYGRGGERGRLGVLATNLNVGFLISLTSSLLFAIIVTSF